MPKTFSHLYVEEGAQEYPMTLRILAAFPEATVVSVSSYKEIFNRPKQDAGAQRKSPKLILGVKKMPFLYSLPDKCQTFGFTRPMYATPALNCMYQCQYCFLQGMYSTGNLVVFVNCEDFFEAADHEAQQRDAASPLSISVSFETDLAAIESFTGYCEAWISFAKAHPNIEIELRSKGTWVPSGAPVANVCLAWSLAPPEVARRWERHAPSPTRRMDALVLAANAGWKVRICLDPLLPVEDWQSHYASMLDDLFQRIPKGAVQDISVGTFRMGETHLRALRKRGILPIAFGDEKQMQAVTIEAVEWLTRYMPRERIFASQ